MDNATDALIQRIIRSTFAHCTVLTIAHRLHTIMDCDRVMVLSSGTLAEFDRPSVLVNVRVCFHMLPVVHFTYMCV